MLKSLLHLPLCSKQMRKLSFHWPSTDAKWKQEQAKQA
jgi:hypothetical protein